MSLPFAKTLFVGSVFALPLQAAPVELGKQFFHKDWAAACDNTLSCEAVSLLGDNQDETTPTVTVARASDAAGTVSVSVSLAEPKGDRFRLFVDSRLISSGMLAKGEYPIRFEGAEAMKLARAMGRGRKLIVRSADKSILGQLTLNGTAAALTHIDAVQNRAGTPAALFAVGKRVLRPKSAPLPVISAQRIGKQEAIPDTGAIVGLVESSACAETRVGVTEDSAYSLGKHGGIYKALVMLSCGNGAYNFSSAPFVGTSKDGRKWSFAPARFDYPAETDKAMGGVNLLVNSGWDAESQQISSYAKGRGIGDCGRAETYVWDGDIFRLVEAYAMDKCRGSTEWMRLWRTKVEFRN
jgi:Protein of unknown function (DUF1176)